METTWGRLRIVVVYVFYLCFLCLGFPQKKGLTNFPVSTTWFTVAEMQWFPFLQKKDQQTRFTVNHTALVTKLLRFFKK